MNRILAFFFSLISSFVVAESFTHHGIHYQVEVKSSQLICPSFNIVFESRSLPFSIRESKIPYEITMGHYGNPHLLTQHFSYISSSETVEYKSIDNIIPSYEHIDNKRKYVGKLGSCVGSNSVTISFWGGGNCKNVCEAWALVTFNPNGQVVTSKGLSYSDFTKYN